MIAIQGDDEYENDSSEDIKESYDGEHACGLWCGADIEADINQKENCVVGIDRIPPAFSCCDENFSSFGCSI